MRRKVDIGNMRDSKNLVESLKKAVLENCMCVLVYTSLCETGTKNFKY